MAFIGGWLPENWDMPLAIGVGVIVVDLIGDTIKGFIGQFIPANWLDPAAEFVIGIILFIVGNRFLGIGRMATFVKVMSYGAFGIAIADTIGIVLGLGGGAVTTRPGIPTPQQRTRVPGAGIRFG